MLDTVQHDQSVDVVEQWATAEKETRDAAKWFIITLGAVAAAVFGAGPAFLVTTYRLSEDWALVAAQAAFAIIALLAIAYMIREVSHILTPIKVNLEWIAKRPGLEAEFDSAPDLWYPSGVRSIRQLRTQLAELREGSGKLQSGIAYNEARTAVLQVGSTAMNETQRVSELATVEEALHRQRQYLPGFEQSYISAKAYEKKIVSEAALLTLQRRFLTAKGLRNASILGVVSTVLFVTSLSLRPAPDTPSDQPDVGNLVASATPESAALWNLLDLKECESMGQVPVLILSDERDAYVIQTIPWTAGCNPKTFTLTDATGSIVIRKSTNVSVTTVTATASPPP